MRTRLFERRDAEAVHALHRAAFAGEGQAPLFGAAYWRQDRAAPPSLCVVLEDGDGRLVAYCDGFLAGGGGDVNSVGVRPDRRGAGHGRAVLAGFLAEAARRGARAIHLEVAEGNAPARALYARLGFEAVGRRPRYYADGSDALVLAAPLPVSLDADAPAP